MFFLDRVLFLLEFVAGLARDPRRLEGWLLLSALLSAQTLATLRNPTQLEAHRLKVVLLQTVQLLAEDYSRAQEGHSQSPLVRQFRLFAAALLVLIAGSTWDTHRLATLLASCVLVSVLVWLAAAPRAEAHVPGHDRPDVSAQKMDEQEDDAGVQQTACADRHRTRSP
jgi:hypothetical protein